MLAVSTSIGQSRPHRVRAKTLGMCVKRATGPPTGVGGGLFTFSLPFTDTGLTNSTTQYTTGFAVSSPTSTPPKTNEPLFYTEGDGLQDVSGLRPHILERFHLPADGKEVNGYEATYFVREDGENEEKSRTINNADPLSAYKLEDGDWIDTDMDGIYDIVEQDPKNESHRFVNTDYFYGEYEDDEGNISKQFNPNTVDVYKPQIVADNNDGGLDVETKDDWTGQAYVSTRYAWAEITLTAFDSAGIDYVVVKNKDNGKSVRLSVDEAEELHKKSEKSVKNVIRYLEEEGFL